MPHQADETVGLRQEYKYAHSYEGNFVNQQYLPDEVKERRIWQPQNNAAENKHLEQMKQLWGEKYNK
jgi:putative ATPase